MTWWSYQKLWWMDTYTIGACSSKGGALRIPVTNTCVSATVGAGSSKGGEVATNPKAEDSPLLF
jgi:hypothetical protein